MWRGLGRVQRQVLEVLNTKSPDPDSFVYTTGDRIRVRIEGWYNIDNVTYHMLNEFDEDGNLTAYHEATESERQCIWSAIRGLERRGLIEAMTLPISWADRFSNLPKHCGPGYYGKDKRGHRNRKKLIRLAPLAEPIGLDDHKRGKKRERKTRVTKRSHSDKKKDIQPDQSPDVISLTDRERGRKKDTRKTKVTQRQGLIAMQGDEAIALVLSLLEERAKKQPSGFQVSSRAVRKALAEHYDRDTQGVTLLAAFVMRVLIARGILKPFNTTTKRVVYRVDGSHSQVR